MRKADNLPPSCAIVTKSGNPLGPSGPVTVLIYLLFNAGGGYVYLSVVSVVCCVVEISATGRSLVQRIPIDCGVAVCDKQILLTGRPPPKYGVAPQ